MNSEAQHFNPEDWADYVRGLSSVEQIVRMDAHLATGCQVCAQNVRWLRTVAETVARIPAAAEDPPEHLVRQAKSIFAPSATAAAPASSNNASLWDRLETIAAHLAVVSPGDWLPVGVRSGNGAALGERLLYEAGGYAIDLTIDQGQAIGEPGEIIGQITHQHLTSLAPVLVQLCSGSKVLGETETNEFGEFVLQRTGAAKAAVLRFALTDEGRKIELRLKSGKVQ